MGEGHGVDPNPKAIPGTVVICKVHNQPEYYCRDLHHQGSYQPNVEGEIVLDDIEVPTVWVPEQVEALSLQSIKVRHNVEMAHRLSLQPGSKCFQVHGHTWWIDLELMGKVDDQGMVLGLEFGAVKKKWRTWLDEIFDHHFLMNSDDHYRRLKLAGAVFMRHDPTVENVAKLWGSQAKAWWPDAYVSIVVQEAATNSATWKG